MLKDVTIGQYYPTDSVLHRLDPRTKINYTFIFIIALFLINQFVGYIIAFGFLVAIIAISKIPIKYILRGIKALLFIIIITVFINMFITDGKIIFSWWIIKITDTGLYRAAFMAIRLMLLVTGASIMTLCTSPIALTDGIEALMKRIPLIRRYAHELAMMMTIALRFIPTLMQETDKIIKAQKARGADFESGNIIKRAKSLVPILVPLFVSAFKRADDLALAMEARCYRGGENRTRLKELKYHKRDAYAYVFTASMLGLIIASRFIALF